MKLQPGDPPLNSTSDPTNIKGDKYPGSNAQHLSGNSGFGVG